MSQVRQLAAIMFTDIVGYTALMGEDEQKAFDLLEKNRDIQRPIIEQSGGKWIKEIGDCVLASFSTVSDAVICAGTIQQFCIPIPESQASRWYSPRRCDLRKQRCVWGWRQYCIPAADIAKEGGIYISESVYNNVFNKKGIKANFLREEMLKNVKDPVKVYEVSIATSLSPESRTSPGYAPKRSTT